MTTSEIEAISTVTRELSTMLTVEADHLDSGIHRHVWNQVQALEKLIQPDPACRSCNGSGMAQVTLYGDEIPGVAVVTTDVCSCVGTLADAPF